ncbi:hypothetical protein ACROYT_G019858 [Oculina patagonica]
MKMLAVVPLCIVALCFMGCASGACPSGWSQFEEYCYLVNGNEQDWYSADEYCRSLGDGVELVKINSVEENEFVLQFVREEAPGAQSVFIGLLWDNKNRKWKWSDNSDPVFTNWNEGEPNGNANEPCAELYTDHESHGPINGYWNDQECTYRNGLVCKKFAS